MATSVEQELTVGPSGRVRGLRRRLTISRVAEGLAPFAFALLVYLVVFAVMKPSTTGDEPHYLLVAESIAFDGDVDLRNDYASKERTLRVVNVWPLDPIYHAADYGKSGHLRPLHGVGLSALLAPGVALGGLTGARLVMVLIAALLAHQLYRLLVELGFRRRYRIAAWIATVFCLPIVAFSSQIYPELPGALLVLVALRIMVRGAVSPRALALGSAASAALFWLHVRYLPISFALLVGLAYVATSDGRGRAAHVSSRRLSERGRAWGADLRRRVGVAKSSWRTIALPVLGPYVAILGLFVLAFQYWYGSPDPRTPYYAFSTTNVGSGGWKFLYDYGLHDLFNPIAGWIPFVPVHWLGLAALGCVVVWFGWPAVACIAAAAGYEVILASAGPAGGWGLPARYLLIFIPLIAVPLALVIQQLRLARIVFVPLLVGSLLFAVAAVRDYQGLYPARERQTIVGLRSIATAFPVTRPPQPPKSLSVVPGQAKSQTGKLVGDRMVAKAGRDKRGFVLYGAYSTLKSGAYRATFPLASTVPGRVAMVEVIGQGQTVLAREIVRGQELERRRLSDITVSFTTPGDIFIEPRVYYFGRGTLSAGTAQAEALTAAAGPPGHFRDWPLAFLWVGGTIFIGALFVQIMNLARPAPPAGRAASRAPPRPVERAPDGYGAAAVAAPTPIARLFAGPRPFSRAWVEAHRDALVATAALTGVLSVAALAYWWTRAPLYNPSGTIDPWLYTALFVNFDQFYDHFGTSYYASRLPWIAPGRILYGVLPLDAAYWALHGFAFVGGVTALFVLARRYLGLAAAVVGAAMLALTPMYWNAQYWDYVDGVTLTYLLGGLCFGLPLASGRLRAASLAASGLFFAAAVTTNPLAALFALVFPIMYVFVQPATGLRQRLLVAAKDVAAFLVGAAALLVTLGVYARANGGSFLFYEVQINLARSGIAGTSKIPGYEWLRSEARLLVPVFLLLVATPLLVVGRRLPPFRFAAGSVGGLGFLTIVGYGWEFFAGGSLLDFTYAFSYFAGSIALATASTAALALSLARSHRSAHLGAAAAATAAGAVALGLIYRDERAEWTGPTGARISVALMVLAATLILGAVLARRTRAGAVAAAVAIAAVAFASHFAIDSSTGTFTSSGSAPDNGSLYHAAVDQVAFVKRSSKPGDSLPGFWYSGVRPDLISVQSMYYFGYTAIATELPKVTKAMRERLAVWKPQTMVMLCDTRDCGGGAAALRRAGFPYVEENAARISRGRIRFWAVFLRAAAKSDAAAASASP